MSIKLPETRGAITRINPKTLLLYGLPKVGKTHALAQLDDCLILDLEGGADMYEVMSLDCDTVAKFINSLKALEEDMKANGKPKYKYLALDTIDKLEEFVDIAETFKFNKTAKPADKVTSVTELGYGLGYHYIRTGVMAYLARLSKVCERLIVIAHVKEKTLNKGGVEATHRDISLTGKLGSIVCAQTDAIGYMYRSSERGSDLMISFETTDNSVMGSRFERLAGKKFPFNWDTIYIKNDK